MKKMNSRFAGLFATIGGIGLSLSMIAPSAINATGSRFLGGQAKQYCETAAAAKCAGVLPDSECGQVTSTACDMGGSYPNSLSCILSPNQSNACGGQPSTFCIPGDKYCH